VVGWVGRGGRLGCTWWSVGYGVGVL